GRMMVGGGGLPGGGGLSRGVGTIDVLPTALGRLDVPADATLLGRDLRPLIAGRESAGDPLYGESLFGRLSCRWATLREWVRGDWKLISGVEPELYNLATDPHEERNLARDEPDRVSKMTDELRRALGRLAPGGDTAER